MSGTQQQVVTRFAPSPTGHLHVGGARTALFNWAYAKGRGGRFLIRIEDTDRARSSEAAEKAILEDLRWLGLDWDNAGREERQSERRPLYDAAVEKLKAAGSAYEDGGAVRFRMPPHDIVVADKVLGDVTVAAGQIEDFVIRKADGFPTYHLAVVVDDAAMGVTHVIRGQEHLNNAPKHVALQEALGLAKPVYAHIPLIFNPDGSKMSKRDKAKVARTAARVWLDAGHDIDGLAKATAQDAEELAKFLDKRSDDVGIAEAVAGAVNCTLPEIEVADFAGSGYLPEALCNYLALLGWNPGDDLERFDNAFLADRFDFDRVGKSNSKFDREKLGAFNADYIRTMPVERFAERWAAWCGAHRKDFAARFDGGVFAKLAEAYRERARTFADACAMAGFFVDPPEGYDEKAVKKNLEADGGAGYAMLGELAERFKDDDGLHASLKRGMPSGEGFGAAAHELIRVMAEEKGVGMGKVAQPLRVAVSGSTVSPPIDITLDILGRDETVRRIEACLAMRGI